MYAACSKEIRSVPSIQKLDVLHTIDSMSQKLKIMLLASCNFYQFQSMNTPLYTSRYGYASGIKPANYHRGTFGAFKPDQP
jgi:hypothetical protein